MKKFSNQWTEEIERLKTENDDLLKKLERSNDAWIEAKKEIERLRKENAELPRLIDKAADFIGTDPDLRSIACIDVALDYAIVLRSELLD
jgi:predicted nuclease with TOPRIM domain